MKNNQKQSVFFISLMLAIVVSGCLFTPELFGEKTTRIAVMNLGVMGEVKKDTGRIIAEIIRGSLGEFESFEVINRENMRALLGEKKFQQSGACDDASCLVEMGNALGVEKLVVGSLGKMGKKYILTLKLVDLGSTKQENIVTREHSGAIETLTDIAKEAAYQLAEEPKRRGGVVSEKGEKVKYGGISITSTPPGAQVYVDGDDAGKTPASMSKVEVGEKTVLLSKSGYADFTTSVIIKQGVTEKIKARLARQTGKIKFKVKPYGSVVYINGAPKIKVDKDETIMPLRVGEYSVKIEKKSYKSVTRKVRVQYNAMAEVNVALVEVDGAVFVSSTPSGASVYLDGAEIGVSPVKKANVSSGLHKIRVKKAGYRTYEKEITVYPNKTKTLAAVLTAVPKDQVLAIVDSNGMVLIPAGEFAMGGSDGQDDEKPSCRVYLNAYYIDKYEVTNAQYRKFMKATGRKEPRYWNDSKYNKSSHPVVGVSWHDAVAYAKWAGKRLPTEAEWEKAARGTDGRKYPWGNSWDGSKLNFADKNTSYSWRDKTVDDGYQYAAPVGSYEDGKSPYGCYDMSGNVWEWCADWYSKDYYMRSLDKNPKGPSSGKSRVLRGGSWVRNEGNVRCANRSLDYPFTQSYAGGFRCAKTP